MRRRCCPLFATALLAGACALGAPPAVTYESAEAAQRAGDLEAAAEGYTRAIAAAEARGQFDVLFVATAQLADLYLTHPELGREREGVNLWRRVLRQSEALFGADHPMTASAAYELGHAYVAIGEPAAAEPVLARSVAILRAARPGSAETRDAETAWRGVRRQLGMEPELPEAPAPLPEPAEPEGAVGPGAARAGAAGLQAGTGTEPAEDAGSEALDCESAMNYSWHARERILVTPVDVATFVALVSRPNGLRVDGTFLEGVQPPRAEP